MAYSYDDMQGDAQPAHMGSQSSAGGETQMAGDVVKLHPPGYFASNVDKADKINAEKAKAGQSPPNNVIRYPGK